MNVIFLGPPGAGKGTIAKLICDRMQMVQISTGDLLRAAVQDRTPIGLKAKSYMESGALVPDKLVIDLLKERMSQSNSHGYILDGFPRTIAQAEALEKSRIKIDKVINFNAQRDTVIQRLSGRRTCKQCGAIYHLVNIPPQKENVCDKCGGALFQRDDDQPAAIEKRLVVYRQQTALLIAYYQKLGIESDVQVDGKYTLQDNVEHVNKILMGRV